MEESERSKDVGRGYNFKIFYPCQKIWQDIRTFFHNNDSLFEHLFLWIYFFEQLGLLIVILIFRYDLEFLPYIISFFALFLLTTVGVHRLFMESKNRYIKEQKDDFLITYNELESHYNFIYSEFKSQNKVIENLAEENDKLKDKMKL